MEYIDKFKDTNETFSKLNCFSLSSSSSSMEQEQKTQLQQQSKDSSKSNIVGNSRFVLQAAVNAADWMYDLCQINTSITLKDMKIPGSNDSGSYSFEVQPFGTTIQTQNLSIKEQLQAGIRYLDIRVGPSQNIVVTRSPSNIVICSNKSNNRLLSFHHCEGTTLETILYDIKEFCDTHNECIIIELSPALNYNNNDFQADQKFICLDTITKFFGGEEKRKEDKYKYIIPARKVPDIITSVPLYDILHNIYTTPSATTSSHSTSERRQPPSSNNNNELDTVYGNHHHRQKKDMSAPPSSESSTRSFSWQQNRQQKQQEQRYQQQKNTAKTTNSKIILLLNDRFIENEFEDEDVDERFYCMTSKVLCHPRYTNNNNTTTTRTYSTKDNNTIQTLLDKNLDNLKRYESFKYFINTKFVLPNSYTSLLSSSTTLSLSSSSNTFQHPFTMLNTILRNSVAGTTAIKPITAATQLYDSFIVDNFLLQHSSTAKWRICTFDFIDLCPDILDLIISMNFAHSTTRSTTTTASASYHQQMNSNLTVNKNNSYSNDKTYNNTPSLSMTGRNFISMKQPKPDLKINFALIESIKDTSTSNDTNQFRKILTPDDLLSQHLLYNDTIIYFKDPVNDLYIPDQYRTSNNYFRCTVGYTVRRNCNNNKHTTNTANNSTSRKAYHVVTIPFKGDTIYPLIVAPYFCMIHGSDIVMLDVLETDRTVTVTGNCKRNHKGKYTLDLMTLATVVNFFLCNKKNLYTKKITFMLN